MRIVEVVEEVKEVQELGRRSTSPQMNTDEYRYRESGMRERVGVLRYVLSTDSVCGGAREAFREQRKEHRDKPKKISFPGRGKRICDKEYDGEEHHHNQHYFQD